MKVKSSNVLFCTNDHQEDKKRIVTVNKVKQDKQIIKVLCLLFCANFSLSCLHFIKSMFEMRLD